MAGESLERKVLGDFKRYSALLGFWVTAKDSGLFSKGRGWGKSPYSLPSTAWTKTCLVTPPPPPPTPPSFSFPARWKVWWMMTHLLNLRIYCIHCWEYLLISENNKNFRTDMVIIILKIEIHSTMLGELLEIQSTEIIDSLLLYFTTTIFYLSNVMAARKIESFVGC